MTYYAILEIHFKFQPSISNLIRLGLLISTADFLKEGVAERIEKEPYIQEDLEFIISYKVV